MWNKIYGQVSLPGIGMTWGLTVMAIIYSIGPCLWCSPQSLHYHCLQLFLELFPMDHMVGRVVESIITFLLMFVVCAVATYSRASGGFAGLAIGMTILLDARIRSIIEPSKKHRTSYGEAYLYTGLWIYIFGPIIGAIAGIYIVGPIIGAIAGRLAYNLLKFTDKSLIELTKTRNTSKNALTIS
ncbi:hypothetical protein VitviT2T_021737 [Vitis vinifera]|uniref:Uncharacterized protein n=1 Tax=Vitis vinifera TaxID=29760 RepID=A0ABY9D817_VITVI|nr:hypothetical protein VitviT2T_021737 [Vitis vinifera]